MNATEMNFDGNTMVEIDENGVVTYSDDGGLYVYASIDAAIAEMEASIRHNARETNEVWWVQIQRDVRDWLATQRR